MPPWGIDGDLLRTASVPADHPDPASEIYESFAGTDLAQIIVFASPAADLARLSTALHDRFGPQTTTLAITTAGEIGPHGYADGTIVAVGFPRDRFRCRTVEIATPSQTDRNGLAERVVRERLTLSQSSIQMPGGFAILLLDGVSHCEDQLLSALSPPLGNLPLFGGVSGLTRGAPRPGMALNGRVLTDTAVLTLLATDCEVHVFSLDNLAATDTRMVVTEAEPETRRVLQINGAPAAAEYARLAGTEAGALGPGCFAARPLVVRVGDSHHVRAVGAVDARGALVFLSAIEEGMVLRLASCSPVAAHLEQRLDQITMGRQDGRILAFDGLARRLAAERRGEADDVSDVLVRHGVAGFSSSGEQIGRLNVYQTMTGVAIFPPRWAR